MGARVEYDERGKIKTIWLDASPETYDLIDVLERAEAENDAREREQAAS